MLVQALHKVFRKPGLVALALIVSVSAFIFAVWLPNFQLIESIVSSPDVPLSSKIEIPLSLLGSIATNFSLLSASYTAVIAVLFGIYIAMLIYFLKHRVKEVKQSGATTGFFGITSGIVGTGCAACGSLLLTVLSSLGLGGLIAFLPLKGGEFGIIGVLLLFIAVYSLSKMISAPAVCEVK